MQKKLNNFAQGVLYEGPKRAITMSSYSSMWNLADIYLLAMASKIS